MLTESVVEATRLAAMEMKTRDGKSAEGKPGDDQDDGVTTQVITKAVGLRKTTSLRKTSSRHDTIERVVSKTFSDIQSSNTSVADTVAPTQIPAAITTPANDQPELPNAVTQ